MKERRKSFLGFGSVAVGPVALAVAVLAAVLTVLVARGGGVGGEDARSAPASSRPPGGDAAAALSRRAEIVRGRLRPRVLLTGELAAADGQPVTVPRSPIRQVQIRWMAENGSRVRAGDPVVELDNDQVAQEIEEKRLTVSQKLEAWHRVKVEAELAVEDAEFALLRAEADLAKAELEAAVPESLLAAREYQERRLELTRARVEVDKARQALGTARETGHANVEVEAVALARARREVEVAEAALEQLSLKAPGDGIFVVENHPWENRPFQPGDNVWVGFPLAQIPDLSSMVVRAELPDVDDGRVKVGMPARCVLDAYPEREIHGRVVEIAEVAEQPSQESLRRVFEVRVALEESDPDRLRPGMSVKVEVLARPGDDGPGGDDPEGEDLLVPRRALDWSTGEPAIRLAAGGTRPVEVLACDAMRCALADDEGLTPGLRLATAGEGG